METAGGSAGLELQGGQTTDIFPGLLRRGTPPRAGWQLRPLRGARADCVNVDAVVGRTANGRRVRDMSEWNSIGHERGIEGKV